MAVFKPFFGLQYDEAVAGPITDLVAPPYDVISNEDVRELQSRSRYNVTHLTRPLGPNPYDSASSRFQEWKDQGALSVDSEHAFYVYRQTFQDPENDSAIVERIGLVGLLELEDYAAGGVLPHENTLSAAKADRLDLLRTSFANFESIYGLFADPDAQVMKILEQSSEKSVTVLEVPAAIGSSHALSRITDPEMVNVISEYIKSVPIFIADGHHRYETSLAFSKQRPDVPGARYILITLTAFEDDGLLVLPTHRLLRGFGPGEIEILPARLLEKGFGVEMNDARDHNIAASEFVLVTPSQEYRFKLPAEADLATIVPGNQSPSWKSLDVSVLHTLVIDEILGVPLDRLSSTDQISYTRDAVEARRKVASGDAQAAFLMARPTVDQMKKVSEAGDKMPQKSTFFYPKLLSGLVMYDMTIEPG